MLQSFESADHRLDAGANLFVALQQRRPLAGEIFLPMTQGAILLAQLCDHREQFLELPLEALEFRFQTVLVAHGENYRLRARRRQ